MKNYKILQAETSKELAKKTNSYLAHGYSLIGGVNTIKDNESYSFYQSVYLEKDAVSTLPFPFTAEDLEDLIVEMYEQTVIVDNNANVILSVSLSRIINEMQSSMQGTPAQFVTAREVKTKIDEKKMDYQTVVGMLNRAYEIVREYLKVCPTVPIVFIRDEYAYTAKIDSNGQVAIGRTA